MGANMRSFGNRRQQIAWSCAAWFAFVFGFGVIFG
jgi:hypothetical protein